MRWRVRAAAAVLAAIVLVPSAPAIASGAREPAGRATEVAPDLGIRLRMLRQLEELNAPKSILEPLTHDDAARVRTGRSVVGYPMADVTGDGVPEVVELDVRFRFVIADDSQAINTVADEEITTIVRMRDGGTGRLHWKKRYDDFVFPARAQVGERTRPGVIVIGGMLSFFAASAGERYLTFDAVRGKTGKRLWSKRYMSVVASYDFTTSVATDSPVSFAFVQARKGRATEILIGLSTISQAMFTMTVATRAVLLSGVDGNEVIHPHVDIGIDWIPFPDAVPDIDGDGLHDYVVINDKGFDPGDGQEPPALGGVIQARRGSDGRSLWTEGGLEFRYFAFTIPLSDVVGDPRRDFGVLTYHRGGSTGLPSLPLLPDLAFYRHFEVVMLVDSGGGEVKWTKRGYWAHSPGDLDRDGDPDVVLERVRFATDQNAIHYSRLAYAGVGKLIWQHDLVWRGEPCLANACLGGGGVGLISAGDVQPDRVSDRFLWLGLYQPPDRAEHATFLLDGDSNDTLIRSDETMMPLWVAVDGKGSDVLNARANRHVAQLRARQGHNGETLWSLHLEGREQLLPRNTAAWGEGIRFAGDRCGDVLINVMTPEGTLYGVVDGGSGEIVWTRWSGNSRVDRPRVAQTRDLNDAC